MKSYFAQRAYVSNRWERDVRIDVNGAGIIVKVESGGDNKGAQLLDGAVIPGMSNLHSHAFQRAMAGLTEVAGHPRDSFWTWREQMYRLVSTMTPEQVGVIARHLYISMLKGGYTQVAEFNYLHHDPDGRAYAGDDMLQQLMNAAKLTGIGQTLLPVLYTYSGFSRQPPVAGQKRFIQDTESYLCQYERVASMVKNEHLINQGICFHSLRAVSESQINQVLSATDKSLNVHIHIAEQQQEVNSCMVWSGKRPVEWLLEHFDVDSRWCLIHATHLSADEREKLSKSGAVAGLCPTTEANLGDGIFPASQYLKAGGKWGIGSDSHVSVNVAEELRLLEYSQRLRDQQRNILTTPENPFVGDVLFSQAAAGGAQACNINAGELRAGNRADWVVLDDKSWFSHCPDEHLLNRWIFAGDKDQIKHVWVAGQMVVQDGHHLHDEESATQFRQVMKTVMR